MEAGSTKITLPVIAKAILFRSALTIRCQEQGKATTSMLYLQASMAIWLAGGHWIRNWMLERMDFGSLSCGHLRQLFQYPTCKENISLISDLLPT